MSASPKPDDRRAADGAPTGPSRVVYIVGSGRSGSTLLERLLGAVPGYVNVGELLDVFRRVVAGDELCGCKATFSQCPFWTGVGRRAFGGWTTELVDETARLQQSVARQRHLPRLVVQAVADDSFRAALKRYGQIYARIYAAVLAESGAEVVVDASKGPAQAVAVSRNPDVDLQLVHLVRDVRGVAFSWSKAGVARPQGGVPGATMARHPPQLTAARWSGLQTEIEIARRSVSGSVVLRYEDLVTAPKRQLARVLTELGLPGVQGGLSHVAGRTIHFEPSHGLSGNPSRFTTGSQQLRLDEQWRRDMSRWDRVSTTTIAIGPLGRYGYLGPRRGGAA